jgi:hypothetical protein
MHAPTQLDFWTVIGIAYITTSIVATTGSIIVMFYQARKWMAKKAEEKTSALQHQNALLKEKLHRMQQDIDDMKAKRSV